MSEKAMKICFSIIGVVVLFTIIVGVITREKEPTLEEKVNLGAILHDGSENNYFTSPEGRYALKITSVYETEPDTTDENAPKIVKILVQ